MFFDRACEVFFFRSRAMIRPRSNYILKVLELTFDRVRVIFLNGSRRYVLLTV